MDIFKVDETVIDIEDYKITIKELSAFDYLAARKLLKEDRDDDVAIELTLAAISMKKIEKLIEPEKEVNGVKIPAKYQEIVLPPVKDAKDILERVKMPLHLWRKFTEKSAEFNKLLNPDSLEK